MDSPPTFAEVLYFTRYLFDPQTWHPDGCLWEIFTPGAAIYYRGYKATVVRHLGRGNITIVYEDAHPYDMPAGLATYEDIHLESALSLLHVEPDYEDRVPRHDPLLDVTPVQSNEDYHRPILMPAAEWDVGDPSYSV